MVGARGSAPSREDVSGEDTKNFKLVLAELVLEKSIQAALKQAEPTETWLRTESREAECRRSILPKKHSQQQGMVLPLSQSQRASTQAPSTTKPSARKTKLHQEGKVFVGAQGRA
ncbi:hypothetical protein F443_01269 [Phytophthora nicotianae P1569]|uniref:Uncharacterized protein n=1 Tax=Phytophthora nicotianae P1569 TaxID=1317065 RepID=V9FZB1_PHYNI|nr:hypothetical protein F443_01269 [Phytophthora nicotianae P1569]